MPLYSRVVRRTSASLLRELMDHSRHPLLLPILVIGVLSISTAAILIKACDDAAPAVIAAARMGVAALILGPPTFLVRGRRAVHIPRHCRLPIILAGLFLGAHFFFWITSLKHTSVLSSVVIVTTNPVFVGLASWLFLGEKLHRTLLYAILLAVAGGALIALSDSRAAPGSLYGNVMSLCGAIMASCYLLMGRKVRRDVDILSYILPVYSIAALLLVAVAALTRENILHYRPATYVYLVALAVVPQLIGHSALNWALRHATATIVAVCILGEPIGASILAYLFLEERVSALQGAGSGLILAGIYMASRRPRTVDPASRCARCGCILTGNVSGICSECGLPVPGGPGQAAALETGN